MAPFDVITVGSATRDVFVKSTSFETHEGEHSPESVEGCFPLGAKIEIDDIVFETGGGATNAAVTFARLGSNTATIFAIGDDASGREIIEALKNEGVSTSFTQRVRGEQTAYSAIIVAGSGERTVLVYRGASKKLDPSLIPWGKLRAKWLYLTSLGGDIGLAGMFIDHAERHGIRVAWNPGAREIAHGMRALDRLIGKTEVFNLNKEEAATLTGKKEVRDMLRIIRPLPRRTAIITDGLNGAYASDREKTWHSATIDVPRVNVTGAGDAFGSGVVAALMKKDDLPYALAVGTWNATGVVQQMGAKRGIIRGFPAGRAIQKVTVSLW